MTTIESIIFSLLLAISLYIFFRRVYTLCAYLFLGKWENRFDRLWERFKGMITYGFLQKRVVQKPFGINHFFLFWGFMVLFLVNMEFVISGVFPKFSLAFLGDIPHHVLNFLADCMSAVVLLAVCAAFVRRLFFKPYYIEATAEAYIILSTVGILMAAYFGMNITAYGLNEKSLESMPVSLFLSSLFVERMDATTLTVLYKVSWWTHALLFLFFLDFIPYSKHLHILTSLPNCFFRNFSFPRALKRMKFMKDIPFGVSKITQYTWKGLLDFMACTECGRCQAACPANFSGKVLNPKEVILHSKHNLFENGSRILASRPFDTVGGVPDTVEVAIPLVGEGHASIQRDAIWDCTTCGACVENCPVLIEHFPKLIDIRRHLVMDEVEFPQELVPFFENIEMRSNPWGLASTERGKWAQNMEIPTFSVKEGHEYLLYAGCMGSFDTRTKKIILSLVSILNNAGISYGILGSEEMCCGDALRRLGNEFIFDRIAIKNVNLFKKLEVRKIITICPHCFNTLKNDYKDYGADYEVFHHSQILQKISDTTLFRQNGNFTKERIVFHDSCYLTRYNNIYTEPRGIIRSVTGNVPLEMERNGRNSFCCGAGGGRMWLEENADTRMNRERTKQALEKNPTIIATSCPFCITMFEDGLKEAENAETIRVMDVGELFVEGMISSTVTDASHNKNDQRRAVNE